MLEVVDGVANSLPVHAVKLVHFKQHDGDEARLPVVAVQHIGPFSHSLAKTPLPPC